MQGGGIAACCEPTSSAELSLSYELWQLLLQQLDLDKEPKQIPVAISARYSTSNDARQTLVEYARRDTGSRLKDQHKHAVVVPSSLATSHPSLFGRPRPSDEAPYPTLLISTTTPLALTSLILVALDAESYAYSSQSRRDFERSLCRPGVVYREGGTVQLRGEGSAGLYKWKVAMAEPVLQGIVEEGKTRFMVMPPQALGGTDVESAASSVNGYSLDDVESSDEEGDYSIDDSFLAPSILLSPPRSTATSPIETPNSLALTNVLSSPPKAAAPPSGLQVQPVSLQQTVPSALLVPRPGEEEDDVARVYLKTTDLGKLGAFSGDWVSVQVGDGDRRIVRVFAAEGLVATSSTSQSGSLTKAYFPPLLLHNLSPTSASSHTPLSSVTLSPLSKFSPSIIPTARSVTIARIASPHSVNRAYQSLFLLGLKDYFQHSRRVLKKGDLIAVGIREEMVRFASAPPAAGGEDADEVDLPALGDSPSAVSAVVFFQITAMEIGREGLSSRGYGAGEGGVEEAVERGELGCVVDPGATKMMQVGVEKSLVPDVAAFVGLPESPLLPVTPPPLGGSTPSSRLYDYATALLRSGVSDYNLDLSVLVKGARGSGKSTVIRSVARQVGFHVLEVDCFELIGETELKTEAHLRASIDKAVSCSPSMLVLRNVEALATKKQALETGQEPAVSTVLRECFAIARDSWKSTGYPVITLATVCDVDKVPISVLGNFKEVLNLEAPAESERLDILRSLTASDLVAPDVSLRALAVQTAALVANDLVDLVSRARSSAIERALSLSHSSSPSLSAVRHAGVALTAHDFNGALEKARSAYSESIGAPKIPSVTWDDVGGLVSVKSDILDTIQLPLEHPELFADGLKKRSGILLYGPPGTGKTLLAKAVATSCSLNFFSVKGPELLNMYIGESEANVRRVFQRARDAKPCVIFFDELDSVAPKRGNQGDSGGVMDRIVSQLLAELDGMAEGSGGTDVFVIGATNRPDLLDPALLRPGRFDRMLYLGVSDTHDSQLKIIQALTRKFKLDPNIALENVANLCPFNYTGADFYALCSDAMLKAMTRKAEEVDTKIADLNTRPPYKNGTALAPQYYLAEMATPAEIEVLVSQADFEAALAELVPSVSQAEMLHYKQVQQQFSAPAKEEAEVASRPKGWEEPAAPKRDKGKGKAKQNPEELPHTNGFSTSPNGQGNPYAHSHT